MIISDNLEVIDLGLALVADSVSDILIPSSWIIRSPFAILDATIWSEITSLTGHFVSYLNLDSAATTLASWNSDSFGGGCSIISVYDITGG